MGEHSAEEWARQRNDAMEANTWITACLGQVERWADAFGRAHLGDDTDVDWDANRQSHVEGYFLVMAAGQLRKSLEQGAHADLLSRLPRPSHVEGMPGETNDGSTYLEHVRNANEHRDDRGWFARDYGYGHGWQVGAADDLLNASVRGIELGPFVAALVRIGEVLEERLAVAIEGFERTMAERRATDPST